MSFEDPLALVALAALPMIAWLWRAQEKRRRLSARAFTNLALLPNLVDRAPGRVRLVAPVLFLVSLALLMVGFARPHAHITVPRREATVVLAMDVSRSMQAADVLPTRMIAARRAASAFLDRIPRDYAVGVVSFGSRASVAIPPTTNHGLVRQALGALSPGDGTAIGDAVVLSAKLGLTQRADGAVPPESVLMLSDGAPDGGRTSVAAAVKRARALHVPVSTVLVGTEQGVIERKLTGGYVEQIHVPASPGTLQAIAAGTGGAFYRARSAGALAAVYEHLATRLGHTTENREVTDVFVLGALVLLLAGGVFAAFRFLRVP